MSSQIPPTTESTRLLWTRNTKEAALLYALKECEPAIDQGKFFARWEQRGLNGEPYLQFYFKHGQLAGRIHAAFEDPDYEAQHAGAVIPDQHMPAVIALIKRVWHNWERLKEVTKDGPSDMLPLHYIVSKGNKIFISPRKPQGDPHP